MELAFYSTDISGSGSVIYHFCQLHEQGVSEHTRVRDEGAVLREGIGMEMTHDCSDAPMNGSDHEIILLIDDVRLARKPGQVFISNICRRHRETKEISHSVNVALTNVSYSSALVDSYQVTGMALQ